MAIVGNGKQKTQEDEQENTEKEAEKSQEEKTKKKGEIQIELRGATKSKEEAVGYKLQDFGVTIVSSTRQYLMRTNNSGGYH